ncbi:response regulator transcription factor [Actinocrinis sp.]|uniref:response regulator transcription factor n=1 Tax=Actinocrinis sp. TaxID=1920516 RepID=UPI002D65FCB7|nr:response regulator transcription factor [Actinocrinis sp.]HZP51895.1 response regulator transcription factor [Actinocrinis sp.]
MEASADVLVVDDDPTVSEVVAAYLRRCGHRVRLAADGPSAVASAHLKRPDLIVLDLMLPGFDGFEVYRRIRRLGPVPVIMLTARGEEHDRILGLELGADDYVTKPFSPRELSLRANSVLRRARHAAAPPDQAADIRRVGDLEVDVTGHQATRGGEPLSLTGREFDLLAFLLAHPGQAFTRAELMQLVWGWDYGDQSTVTVHVRRLREKIEQDPAEPRLLVTVWGVGYRLDPPEAQDALGPPAGAGRTEPAQRGQRGQADVSPNASGNHPPASPSRPSTNPARPGPPSGAHQ